MRNIALALCLSLPSVMVGQKVHELKANVLLPFANVAHLSYEYIPDGRIGVEVEALYWWAVSGYYWIPPVNPHPEAYGTLIEAEQQVLIFAIAGKYYFQKKHIGKGLFAGAYVREDILVTGETDRYGMVAIPEYGQQKNRHLRNGLGVLAGYKAIIKKHFLLEVSLGFDVNTATMFNSENRDPDWFGIPAIKAGYRF